MFTLIAWLGYLVALVTGIAMLKDTFVDRGARRRIIDVLQVAWIQTRAEGRPDMEALQRSAGHRTPGLGTACSLTSSSRLRSAARLRVPPVGPHRCTGP